jgi:hypothetical protein
VTVPSARCSARARPTAARIHHRPSAARPGHDHDPDPAAHKAAELDPRAQPAASHGPHPPAVAVDPGADQREWHSSAVQPSTRLACGVPSAATTTSTSRMPARSGPWVASERADVSAVTLAGDEREEHARRGTTRPLPQRLQWSAPAPPALARIVRSEGVRLGRDHARSYSEEAQRDLVDPDYA